MAILLITHDLGVVAEVADEVVVMYAGRVVERGPTEAIFAGPRHPYTHGLLGSLPGVREPGEGAGARQADGSRRRLMTIPGVVPDLRDLPPGCRFRARCDRAVERCAADDPALEAGAHAAACWNPLPREGSAS